MGDTKRPISTWRKGAAPIVVGSLHYSLKGMFRHVILEIYRNHCRATSQTEIYISSRCEALEDLLESAIEKSDTRPNSST